MLDLQADPAQEYVQPVRVDPAVSGATSVRSSVTWFSFANGGLPQASA